MTAFQDLFSSHAADYARYRPRYPAKLFTWLAGLVPQRRLAWDCATGNGQAALGLVEHFDRVIATDASEAQIAHAVPHDRIEYRVALAENSGLESQRVDLITVAQALHWFRFDDFYAEARRVARPGGVLAAWSYGINHVTPAVDAICHRLYEITGPYWPPDRRYIDERYETIPFPFEELHPPRESLDPNPSRKGGASARMEGVDRKQIASSKTPFECREDWTLADFAGYLTSWSGTQRFMKERGYNPLEDVWSDLASTWGDSDHRRTVAWPIHMRIGKAGGAP